MTKILGNRGILALYMEGVLNPHDEIKGSNPSPGAFFEGIRGYYKAYESKNSAKLELESIFQQPTVMIIIPNRLPNSHK
jgi:hypothetical protein